MKTYNGLSDSQVLENRINFGENKITPPKRTPWYVLLLEKFKDPIIIILLIATAISLVVGFFQGSYIESVSIIAAVILATSISFYMEYESKKKFEALNQISDNTELIKVIRNSNVTKIPKTELVVGDYVILQSGDDIPADMYLIEALELKVDQATMTGESIPAEKEARTEENKNYNGFGIAPYVVLRGTTVVNGSAIGEVYAVGDSTEIGQLTKEAQEEINEDTPLNRQLNKLAGIISKSVFILAGLLLVILNVHHFFFTDFEKGFMSIFQTEISFLMICLALIIAGVPEGLGTAIIVSLSYAMKSMMKENNLVKKLHACETIGCITHIFSDKTGTITQAKLSVVGTLFYNRKNLFINAALNSTANLDENGMVIGDPTEGAILNYLKNKTDVNYSEIRQNYFILDQKPFNSNDKYMLTSYIREDGEKGIFVKGAPEVIFNLAKGKNNKNEGHIKDQSRRGRRALSFASGIDMEHLNYDGTMFMEDPLRKDVKNALSECYEAGVDVVMLTGDNIDTAAEIARQAGFNRKLQRDEKKKVWAIEAKDFDRCAWGDPNCGYPNVVARCKPTDKINILKSFKSFGEYYVVGATGDGINDSGLLSQADVGLAMGSGTNVAKEASDIVLLDDSFKSIVTGIKWGRSLYKNIQSFLVGQLTINVAICLTALFGPILGVELPFTVTQMLWVNIVMDAVMALAVSTEKADPGVMRNKPRKQSDFIINKKMYLNFFGTGIMISVILSAIILDIAHNNGNFFHLDLTGLFTLFLMLCVFNTFNVRVFDRNKSIFSGLGNNKWFLIGVGIMFFGTIAVVQFGGNAFNTRPIDLVEWICIITISSMITIIPEIIYQVRKK